MTRLSVFGPGRRPAAEPQADGVTRLRVLITARAATDPCDRYDAIVYATGISTDPRRPGWIRLYPIGAWEPGDGKSFQPYDIISVDAHPARQDPRRESWQPVAHTMLAEDHLKQWQARRPWLDPQIEDSMCRLERTARERPDAKSLALVRPTDIDRLRVVPHPGWTGTDEQHLDAYLRHIGLPDDRDRLPPTAPRFKGAYRYRCHDRGCGGHEQDVVDGEFTDLQRRLADLSDARLRQALQTNFLDRRCGADREVAFYVGNRADRPAAFDVLGTYWPPRR